MKTREEFAQLVDSVDDKAVSYAYSCEFGNRAQNISANKRLEQSRTALLAAWDELVAENERLKAENAEMQAKHAPDEVN